METETREVNGTEYTVGFVPEEYPDLSYLGRYTSHCQEGAIDRKHNGAMGRNEYRFFVPSFTPQDVEDNRKYLSRHGESKHQAWVRSVRIPREEYRRMEEYNHGWWYVMGIVVSRTSEACPHCHRAIEHESSLWGVESDCGDEYIEGIIEDLITELEES